MVFAGDSFTLGLDVEVGWVSRLEQKLGGKVEILNLGVCGYGMDQAFLKWKRQGLKFNADTAFLCVFLENIFRNVNIVRPFYIPETSIPLSKPRFIIDGQGKLELINSPVIPLRQLKQVVLNFPDSPWLKHEYFYYDSLMENKHSFFNKDFFQQWFIAKSSIFQFISKRIIYRKNTYEYALKPGSEPYEIAVAIATAFQKEALMNNIDPHIIIIPDQEHFVNYNQKKFFWQDFLKELGRRKIKFLDLTPELYRIIKVEHLAVKDLYNSHFTDTASDIMAEIVRRYYLTRIIRES